MQNNLIGKFVYICEILIQYYQMTLRSLSVWVPCKCVCVRECERRRYICMCVSASACMWGTWAAAAAVRLCIVSVCLCVRNKYTHTYRVPINVIIVSFSCLQGGTGLHFRKNEFFFVLINANASAMRSTCIHTDMCVNNMSICMQHVYIFMSRNYIFRFLATICYIN